MVLIGVLGKNMGEFILPDSPSVLGGSMPKNCVSLISMLIPMFRVKSLVIAHCVKRERNKETKILDLADSARSGTIWAKPKIWGIWLGNEKWFRNNLPKSGRFWQILITKCKLFIFVQ